MKGLQIATLVVSLAALALLALLVGRGTAPAGAFDAEALREEAALLRAGGLYREAAERYEQYLGRVRLPAAEAAGLHYLLGTLYQDELLDHERALAQYLILRDRYGETEAADKAGRRIVQCQEELGRTREAQRTLATLTDLAPAAVESASAGLVVAKVGDREITLGQVEALLAEMPEWQRAAVADDPDRKKQFVREFVVRELLYDRALRRGYDDDPVYKRRLATIQRQLLAERVREEEVTKRVSVSEGDLKRYHETHRDRYTTPAEVEVAHILQPSEASAEAVLDRLARGEAFAELARSLSTDAETGAHGGALGRMQEGRPIPVIDYQPEISAALMALEVGEATGPFRTERGVHVFGVTAKTPKRVLGLDEARSQVEADLRREKEEEAFQELVRELLRTENAAIFEERIEG